ncbi:MAG: cytochrome c oxidase assembly protein [Acidimicrobiaceae bacterium]|nr:cytochrome c oxidase assembly protein [Acidimicrobiia bacterium]MCY4492297.1 cytochrome c oxidase assembly protein [Acidimicrobiaceae bacterium]
MSGPWEFEAHPAVWLLIAAIVALGYYAVRHIGPLVVPDGQTVVTKRQKRCFALAVLLLWVASDWPMHDIAEEYLYSVHMAQHLLIAFIVPPLLLLAMPEWLARLIVVDGGAVSRVLRVLTRPVLAAVVFNALQILSHWGAVVNLSVENGVFHYTIHLAVFFSALLMWFCVVGPLPEFQISEPAKMVYLFASSIVPTVPAGWLTFAEGVVYSAYDHADPLWGISPTDDQQAAGAVMKVVGGFYLWALITIRYFRFTSGRREADIARRRTRRQPPPRPERVGAVATTGDLTFGDVQRAFDENPEPPREPPT